MGNNILMAEKLTQIIMMPQSTTFLNLHIYKYFDTKSVSMVKKGGLTFFCTTQSTSFRYWRGISFPRSKLLKPNVIWKSTLNQKQHFRLKDRKFTILSRNGVSMEVIFKVNWNPFRLFFSIPAMVALIGTFVTFSKGSGATFSA